MEQLVNKDTSTYDDKEFPMRTSSSLGSFSQSGDNNTIQIYIEDPPSITIILNIDPTTTIANVKQMIEEKHDSHPEKQCLMFEGKILLDTLTLQNYNIEKDSRIELHFGSQNERPSAKGASKIMDLTILYLRKTYALTVISTTRVKDLKTTVSHLFGLDIMKIALVSQWKVLLEEDNTLMDYGLAMGVDPKIEVISASEGKLALFVDKFDNRGNPERFKKLEEKGISCVLCTSTIGALEVIGRNIWLIGKDKLRIITNLVRVENGKDNYYAGIHFINQLRQIFNYKGKVMIFCGDLKKAQESCKKEKVKGDYLLSNLDRDLMTFLDF